MKPTRIISAAVLVGVGAAAGYLIGAHGRQDQVRHQERARAEPTERRPVLTPPTESPVAVGTGAGTASKDFPRSIDPDELDPSFFEPLNAVDSKVKVIRMGKRDLLKEIERLRIDSSVLEVALYDSAKTVSAQRIILKYLEDRSTLDAELAGAGSESALRELKRNAKNYQPIPEERAESVMSSMGNPRKIWTSEGSFIVDVAVLNDHEFSEKQRDIEGRIFDRTSAFIGDVRALRQD